jgi:chemosensory pili system protein ChpA (sensor histidine kinase/response regulator)
MKARLVPFDRNVPRFERLLRQVSGELKKLVRLEVIGGDTLIDRTLQDKLVGPLEHVLRNALDHGVEMADKRIAANKPEVATIRIEVRTQAGFAHISIHDDGAGVNTEKVRAKAIDRGIISAQDELSEYEIHQLVFHAGLSTAEKVTQISGRGVGMDVVVAETKLLGGQVELRSSKDEGTTIVLALPLTVTLNDALKCTAAGQLYAVPLAQIEEIINVPTALLLQYWRERKPTLEVHGRNLTVRALTEFIDGKLHLDDFIDYAQTPLIISKNQANPIAIAVQKLVGTRESIMIKPIAKQLAYVDGIAGVTLEGNGTTSLVLDIPSISKALQQRTTAPIATSAAMPSMATAGKRNLIFVVDDSVTVRKVTSRLLNRHGYDVITAIDGVDALEKLENQYPSLMILDIEMPRMDGFELASKIRMHAVLSKVPIIMITSRTGDKHREKAFQCGVDSYLGKPYKEQELLNNIETLVAAAEFA